MIPCCVTPQHLTALTCNDVHQKVCCVLFSWFVEAHKCHVVQGQVLRTSIHHIATIAQQKAAVKHVEDGTPVCHETVS